MSDFHDDYQRLPPPGGYVTRLPGPPCGDCGATVFEVMRCRREARQEDGTIRRWETVDVQCPRCELLTARTAKSRTAIGTFDTATGRLDIPADRERKAS